MPAEVMVRVDYRDSALRVLDKGLVVWERRIEFGYVDLVLGFCQHMQLKHQILIGRQASEQYLTLYLSLLPMKPERIATMRGRSVVNGTPVAIEVPTGELREMAYQYIGRLTNYLRYAFKTFEVRDDETIDAAYLPDRYKTLLQTQPVILNGEFKYTRHLVDLLTEATGAIFIVAPDD